MKKQYDCKYLFVNIYVYIRFIFLIINTFSLNYIILLSDAFLSLIKREDNNMIAKIFP